MRVLFFGLCNKLHTFIKRNTNEVLLLALTSILRVTPLRSIAGS